ncbi:MAG TPA: DUF2251 domain-containing protein, partial [Kofleriaceae bacterium]|nr:DUF2251 domain-containing protein [Kofleriaceae bacterium]
SRGQFGGGGGVLIRFSGPDAYPVPLPGSGFGVVFEDDGETGYLYVTNEGATEIFDALHLYDRGGPGQVVAGEELDVVWNPALERAGLHYHGAFQAVIDFANRRAMCRTGFPPADSRWCRGTHAWDDDLLVGLEEPQPS